MDKNKVFLVLLIVLLLAIIVSCSIFLNNLTREEEIDPLCTSRAMGLIGSEMIVSFVTPERGNSYCEYTFPGAQVEFLKPRTTERSCSVHWGDRQGENTNWLHGGFKISRTHNEQMVDDNGFILGTNRFTFDVIVYDVSSYYVNTAEESYRKIIMTIPLNKHIVFSDCGFVK